MGRMKGGAATTTASSKVNFDVTGRHRRDERARGGWSRMMRPGGGARAVVLALNNVPWREEPRQTRALPPRQNKIGGQFWRWEN